jgi:hypothetical protein
LVDTNLISYDYSAEFPVKEAPTGGTTLTAAMLTPDPNGMIVLGTAGATTPTLYYLGGDLTIPNDKTLNVLEGSFSKTTTTTTGTGQNKVTTTTTTSYAGSSTASLELYGYGDISISGNGATLPFPLEEGGEDASKLKVYGTNPTPGVQKIDIGGNGSFVGVLYAPAANIAFNGGGTNGVFAGAVIGYDVKVNGSGYIIRYQEGLGNLTGVRVYNVSKWLELTNPSDWHTF